MGERLFQAEIKNDLHKCRSAARSECPSVPDTMFTANKNRLYIAYLVRHRKRPTDTKFHSCLLLSPKNPKDVTAEESYQYHSLNVIDPTSKKEIWKYEMQRVQNRTIRVQGVQLVGKLDKNLGGLALDEILRQVTVVQDEPSWICQNWVFDAITVHNFQLVIDLCLLFVVLD